MIRDKVGCDLLHHILGLRVVFILDSCFPIWHDPTPLKELECCSVLESKHCRHSSFSVFHSVVSYVSVLLVRSI